MSRLSISTCYATAHPDPPAAGMAPWMPAVRVGGPRDMRSGARIFAVLAALVVLTRSLSA